MRVYLCLQCPPHNTPAPETSVFLHVIVCFAAVVRLLVFLCLYRVRQKVAP